MPTPEPLQSVEVVLTRRSGYLFEAHFPATDLEPIILDEPPPLGGGEGPNASRLLTSAVTNCLTASLLFCLGKGGQSPSWVESRGVASLVRNVGGRLRVARITVDIHIKGVTLEGPRERRCLDLFEEYCVVSASVRQGIPMAVRVWLDEALVHEVCD